GVVAIELLFGDDQVDRLADRDFHGFVQVLVETHRDEVRRRFGSWPVEASALAEEEPERASQRRLEGGDIHLAIALTGMCGPPLKERAWHVDGDEKGRTGDELLVIKVARVDARRGAADAAGGLRWRDAHAAEERSQWDLDVLGEARDHFLGVERD